MSNAAAKYLHGPTHAPGGPADLSAYYLALTAAPIADAPGLGAFFPEAHGATGLGTGNDAAGLAAAATAAAAAGGSLFLRPGATYLVGSAATIADGVTVYGNHATIKTSGVTGAIISGSNCTYQMVKFAGNGVGVAALSATSKVRVNVLDCEITGFTGHGLLYTQTTDSMIARNYIHDCTGAIAAELNQADRTSVATNLIAACAHGIEMWGGDAAIHTLADPGVGVFDLTVTGNIVHDVTGGGIWASLGGRITVSGNTVRSCGDVGIDFEGSYNCTATGNSVLACTNGALTTFYGSYQVTFAGNVVDQTGGYGPAVKVNNTGTTRLLTVSGNTLMVDGATDCVASDAGALENAAITGNIIRTGSGRCVRVLDGAGRVTITGNDMATATGPTGVSIEGPSYCLVADNSIRADGDTSGVGFGVGGVLLYWRSGTYPTQHNVVRGNLVAGFVNGIVDDCWGDNASKNVIEFNRADTITHRGTTSYQGLIRGNTSVTSTLTANPISTKTSNYSMNDVTDRVILASGAATTITLPYANAAKGQIYYVRNVDGTNTITVAAAGGNVDGAATATQTANVAKRWVSNGSDWFSV